MAMTNETMAPAVEPNPVTKPVLTVEQIKQLQQNLAPKEPVIVEDEAFAGVAAAFEDQVSQEAKTAKKIMEEQNQTQLKMTGKSVASLLEEDAYNLDIVIAAGAHYNPNALKVVLKDPNYIARWGNRNDIRMAQLVAQGFRYVKEEDVANLSTLEMFLDGHKHFVYSDLVCMKIPKNIYYAGLRRAYIKSLHATNSRKASEAGSTFAETNLNSSLSGAERGYLAQHKQNTNKDVYDPNIGV